MSHFSTLSHNDFVLNQVEIYNFYFLSLLHSNLNFKKIENKNSTVWSDVLFRYQLINWTSDWFGNRQAERLDVSKPVNFQFEVYLCTFSSVLVN